MSPVILFLAIILIARGSEYDDWRITLVSYTGGLLLLILANIKKKTSHEN